MLLVVLNLNAVWKIVFSQKKYLEKPDKKVVMMDAEPDFSNLHTYIPPGSITTWYWLKIIDSKTNRWFTRYIIKG
jgi:hypothetical protein